MTLNYGIFDSADPASPDRTYTATLLSRIVSKYLKNGIITGDLNEMAVTATDPPAMSVTVGTGTAIVQGRFCENDAALTLPVTTAHSTRARIDRVVVRLSAVSGRNVDIVVITGTAAPTPTAPALTQTSDTWEIPLVQIAVGAGVTSILTANITDEREFPDMTNLFKAAVAMLSDLDIGGNVDITGKLDVSGGVSFGSGVTFDGGVVADLTGDITGYIKRALKISTSPGIFVLGEVIPAKTESNEGTSLSGDIATGIVARTVALGATNPAFGIFKNLGFGSEIPYNVVVTVYHNSTLSWTITTKNSLGTTIRTYSGNGSQSIDVTVQVTAETDTISYTISSPYFNSSSASIAAYSASFD